jgi:peptidoglycan biosynthesis protein MviN/MurJ (putative lipid II flippase)
MQDGEHRRIRSAGSISARTALCRTAGFIRDNLQVTLLGAANSSDAFVIAFRTPNLLRVMAGGGGRP